MAAPTPEEFMHTDTLQDVKNRKGWAIGERTSVSPDPDSRVTIGTRGQERGETNG